MKLYIHGCDCGVNSIYTRAVKRYAQANDMEFEIKNSKYSETDRIEHATYLSVAHLNLDTYQPIVVDGGKVVGLREWQSLYPS